MKKITFITSFVFSFALLFQLHVFADEPAEPKSYNIVLENDTIFYMTHEWDNEQGYPKSGLYKNTNPPKLIYNIESTKITDYTGYVFETEFNLSSDGKYYAVLPFWSQQEEDAGAIEFYKNGKLIKSYDVSSLIIDKENMQYTESHIIWHIGSKRKFDNENNFLTVHTLENNIIIFDIKTSAIIKGYPKKGWQTIEENKYYFNKEGGMLTKSTNLNAVRYKFSADGVCQGKYTGWTKSVDGKRYYYEDGIKQPEKFTAQ